MDSVPGQCAEPVQGEANPHGALGHDPHTVTTATQAACAALEGQKLTCSRQMCCSSECAITLPAQRLWPAMQLPGAGRAKTPEGDDRPEATCSWRGLAGGSLQGALHAGGRLGALRLLLLQLRRQVLPAAPVQLGRCWWWCLVRLQISRLGERQALSGRALLLLLLLQLLHRRGVLLGTGVSTGKLLSSYLCPGGAQDGRLRNAGRGRWPLALGADGLPLLHGCQRLSETLALRVGRP